MKTAKVLITAKKVFDGLGNRYAAGDITPPLPFEKAARIVAVGKGEFVDNDATKEDAQDAAQADVRQSQAKTAETRMAMFDDLPKTIRELAREHGNQVVERYLGGENAYALKREYNGNGT